jgi:hypothetical protein
MPVLCYNIVACPHKHFCFASQVCAGVYFGQTYTHNYSDYDRRTIALEKVNFKAFLVAIHSKVGSGSEVARAPEITKLAKTRDLREKIVRDHYQGQRRACC